MHRLFLGPARANAGHATAHGHLSSGRYRGWRRPWIVLGTFLTYVYESLPPILFLMGSAFFGGIAMAVYTPPALRPGPAKMTLLAAVSAFYVVFAAFSVVRVGRLLLSS